MISAWELSKRRALRLCLPLELIWITALETLDNNSLDVNEIQFAGDATSGLETVLNHH